MEVLAWEERQHAVKAPHAWLALHPQPSWHAAASTVGLAAVMSLTASMARSGQEQGTCQHTWQPMHTCRAPKASAAHRRHLMASHTPKRM